MDNVRKTNAIIRIVFLLNMLGLSIGDAFNVIYVKRLAQRMVSADKLDIYVSLPITAMSIMMILGVVMSGAILKSCGGMLRFLKLCSMITALGMLVRSLAFNYWILFLGFAIDGFGYGCIFLAIRYYAFRLKDNMDVINSLVYINGGAFAGQCMGTILGGILAGQIEYRAVYMMATIILIVPLFILEKIELHGKPQIGNIKVIFGVLRNRSAMCFIVFLIIPIYMCNVFMSYTVPLDVDGYGFSSTVISGIMLIDYVISAYASPFMTTLVLNMMSSKKASILYSSVIAALIAVYTVFKGMPLLILIAVFFGIADSFGMSAMMDAYNKTKGNYRYSNNDALTIYIIMTRVGMALAPTCILIFGNTLILSVIVAVGIILFCITGRQKTRKMT